MSNVRSKFHSLSRSDGSSLQLCGTVSPRINVAVSALEC